MDVVDDQGYVEYSPDDRGYVPEGMCIGGGDDVQLTIDVDTGQIIGWDAERVKARIKELQGE
jgi:hypothetical protein